MNGKLHAWPLRRWANVTPTKLNEMLDALEPQEGRQGAVAHFDWIVREGGRVWIGIVEGEPAGYVVLLPMPGLPQMGELRGGVLPAWRRRGLGSAWLARLQQEAEGWTFQVLVKDLDGERARFLSQRGFAVDHEEILLARNLRDPLPSPPDAPELTVRALAGSRAPATFVELYDASFAPHSWYQPYTVDEVRGTLQKRHTLYFLFEQETPVGFVWARQRSEGVELEPLGIAGHRQGRGWGRQLLLEVLHALRGQGATRALLAVWAENEPARRLYAGLGFTERRRRYYLRWPP